MMNEEDNTRYIEMLERKLDEAKQVEYDIEDRERLQRRREECSSLKIRADSARTKTLKAFDNLYEYFFHELIHGPKDRKLRSTNYVALIKLAKECRDVSGGYEKLVAALETFKEYVPAEDSHRVEEFKKYMADYPKDWPALNEHRLTVLTSGHKVTFDELHIERFDLSERSLTITFMGGNHWVKIVDSSNPVHGKQHMTSENDLSDYIGAKLKEIVAMEIKRFRECNKVMESQILDINTSKGIFSVCCYNEYEREGERDNEYKQMRLGLGGNIGLDLWKNN